MNMDVEIKHSILSGGELESNPLYRKLLTLPPHGDRSLLWGQKHYSLTVENI